MFPRGNHTSVHVDAQDNDLELVKEYIMNALGGDTKEIFRFVENWNKPLVVDTPIAGTLTTERASTEIMESKVGTLKEAKVNSLVKKLIQAGAKFGFDGFEQNGCAAPTPFILIIDAESEMVYGVDLNPCSEG